jgi:hypothetical protein
MTEDQIRDLLREMRDEPIPADSLARVRLGVANRTQAASWTRTLRRPWSIAAMLVAAACVVFAILSLRTPAPIATPTRPIVAHNESAPTAPPAPPPVIAVRSPRLRPHPAVKPARRVENISASEPSVLIRIETPDPNVVILLLGDGD